MAPDVPPAAPRPDTSSEVPPKITVTDACMGAEMCRFIAPALFAIVGGRSHPIEAAYDPDEALEAAESCPVNAILLRQ